MVHSLLIIRLFVLDSSSLLCFFEIEFEDLCVFEQIILEIKGSHAYLTLRCGVAKIGNKMIKVGSCVKLPGMCRLDFMMPKNWEEMKKEIDEENEGKKKDESAPVTEEKKKDEDGEKAKLYYHDVERQDAVIEEKNNFLNKVFRGNVGLMVSTMIEQDDLSEEDIDELIRLLEKKRGVN